MDNVILYDFKKGAVRIQQGKYWLYIDINDLPQLINQLTQLNGQLMTWNDLKKELKTKVFEDNRAN